MSKAYKNSKRTYKGIVEQVRNCLEWHQEMAEDNDVTLQAILSVFKESDIYIEGGHSLQ